MGKPTLTWSTTGGILYNNAYVYDSSGPNPAPGVPVENYKKTRYYVYHEGSGTEGQPNYVAPYYTTSYTSTNPHHNNMIAIKGGVYEKAEFITSTAGSANKPSVGTSFGTNVVFIDSGSTSPLSYGPIIPYADGDSKGANIEANVGWTASTSNATAGFHANNTKTFLESYGE